MHLALDSFPNEAGNPPGIRTLFTIAHPLGRAHLRYPTLQSAGSGAYTPGAQPPSSNGAARAGGPPRDTGVTGGGADPFTGAGAQSSSSAAPVLPAPQLQQQLQQVFFIFDAPPRAGAVAGKVRELSSGLSAAPGAPDLALSEAEVAPGGVLDALLSRCAPVVPYEVAFACVLSMVGRLWCEVSCLEAFFQDVSCKHNGVT